MRTYGVVPAPIGGQQWVEVTTDQNGYNDLVYLTTLCQVLQLNRGESPFYANYGIPVLQSVQTQVPPDYYVMQTQAQFAPYFASLTVARATASDGSPVYNIRVVTHSGAILTVTSVGYLAAPGGGYVGVPGGGYVGAPGSTIPEIPT